MSTPESNTEEKVKESPAPLWKKIDATVPGTNCLLCVKDLVDPVNLGDLYQIDNVTCHYFCLLLSSSLVQNGEDHEGIQGFLSQDILKEVRRASRLKCSYCKKKGAAIGCIVKSCRQMFHLPCGLENGSMHQFFDSFKSFCSSHRPHQKVPPKCIKLMKEDEDSKICTICYDSVNSKVSNDTLWAPCCRKRWFHRQCLQRQALAQGYFFKCPMCNNINKFKSEMKMFGIYIPDMDAAWERDPEAFQDLLHSHRTCDAKACQCPDGRSFTQNTGSWRLLRCNSCGSQGTHIICGGLKISASSNSWRCSLCSSIMNKGKESRMHDSFGTTSTRPSIGTTLSSVHNTSSGSSMSATSSGNSIIAAISGIAACATSSETLSTATSSSGTIAIVSAGRSTLSSPSGSSMVSTISSPQTSSRERRPVELDFEQDRKRRKSSPDSTSIDKNKPELVEQETHVLELLDSDDDEIIVVDESESEIEVVEIEKTSSPLRTYPVSSELLTKDGRTIKVHKVSAEGLTTPLETGSLGSVNMRPAEPKSDLTQSRKVKNKEGKPDSTSHPSASKGSAPRPSRSLLNITKPSLSMFASGQLEQTSGASSTLGIKISDVRHTNELFFDTRKEDGAENAQKAGVQPSEKLLEMFRNLPKNSVIFMPVTTNGQTTYQPCIPVNALSPSQQQQLLLAQQQLVTKDKPQASPDVVTLE